MLRNNTKKITVCLIMVFLLVVSLKPVFALTVEDLFAEVSDDDAEKIPEGTKAQDQQTLLDTTKTTNPPVASGTEENKPQDTPDLGLDNSATLVLIMIFVASAVFAYIKVKKYNV